jgi:hypothetical protein
MRYLVKGIVPILFLILFGGVAVMQCGGGSGGGADNGDPPVTYKLRDRGPANGWIFYINPNAETDGWTYLEAAPEDIGEFQWGGQSEVVGITGGTLYDIGDGEESTQRIIDFYDGLTPDYYTNDFSVNVTFTNPDCTFIADNNGEVAAKKCAEYTTEHSGTVFDDWFLPTKNELFCMYRNLWRGTNDDEGNARYTKVGNFNNATYWNSTEAGASCGQAMEVSFSSGSGHSKQKSLSYRVRAVRAF